MNLTNCIKPYNKSKNKNLKPCTPYAASTNSHFYNIKKLQLTARNCWQGTDNYSYYTLGQELMFIEQDNLTPSADVNELRLNDHYLS